nr:GDP-fucose protein O-fucosyltransferase protein [Ipomoea batatas]
MLLQTGTRRNVSPVPSAVMEIAAIAPFSHTLGHLDNHAQGISSIYAAKSTFKALVFCPHIRALGCSYSPRLRYPASKDEGDMAAHSALISVGFTVAQPGSQLETIVSTDGEQEEASASSEERDRARDYQQRRDSRNSSVIDPLKSPYTHPAPELHVQCLNLVICGGYGLGCINPPDSLNIVIGTTHVCCFDVSSSNIAGNS